jgi:hypothetical protein
MQAIAPILLAVGLNAMTACAAECTASSGAQRAHLLELYTSEGCSSCPPADRWLTRLRGQNLPGAALVPLALHVDYWNRLGWPDRFSSAAHSARQQRIAQVNRSRTVYTPQFVLDGRDWRPGNAAAPEADNIPAGADLRLTLDAAARGHLAVGGEARMRTSASDAALYLALHEHNLASHIAAGENAGKQLRHDYVVRALVGPIPIPAAGVLPIRHTFALAHDWKRADLGVSAFVQNTVSGEVYQALQMGLCPG